jgi:hypothetical protein
VSCPSTSLRPESASPFFVGYKAINLGDLW